MQMSQEICLELPLVSRLKPPTLPGITESPIAFAADVCPVLVGLRRAPQSARRVRHRGAGAASNRSCEFSGIIFKAICHNIRTFYSSSGLIDMCYIRHNNPFSVPQYPFITVIKIKIKISGE